ncbi:FecR family protein [Pedobacter caeni]|uniref:FecR family protein n=1 Tax=Pedobacter caeni TaxID=288992 RepID=A0A1M5HY98_9SPHI|nr:FecR family protein [Pedobacter caeni]
MKEVEFKHLIEKYLDGKASKAEQVLLFNFYDQLQEEEVEWDPSVMGDAEEVERVILGRINVNVDANEVRPLIKRFPWWSVAASLLILLNLGLYFYSSQEAPHKATEEAISKIKAGGDKAFLILANGTRLSLTDADTGKIAEQMGLKISKSADGQLIYTVSDTKSSLQTTKPVYNKIETPLGGKYQINLPDGTKVWLNAASSLRYPVVFTGTERRVELTGEGYFEVSKDKNKRFIVSTEGQELSVFGTHFNINAYADEPAIKTTLLEGSVKVSQTNQSAQGQPALSRFLNPGQQSILNAKTFEVKKVDTESAVDWKNGRFIFNNEDIQSAMRKLSRWYSIKVSYEGNFKNINFGGSFSRSNHLADIIKILEATNEFKFEVEGREVKIVK